MKKLIVVAAMIYGAFVLSRSIPSAGFYLFLLPAAAVLVLVWRNRSANIGQSQQERARTREAARAVRAGMTYAQASHQYGIPEATIRRHRRQVFHLYFE
jgi:hypothetical protein